MRARRQEIVDEYVEDGRAAVYTTAGMVVLLSELATSAWQMLGPDWIEIDRIEARLVEEHGEPADGSSEDLTARALRSLAELSLADLDADEPST
jgi:hypothetical protein